MEWYWWVIIVVTVLAVWATLELVIESGEEEQLETEEKAEEKQKLVLLSLSNDGTVK